MKRTAIVVAVVIGAAACIAAAFGVAWIAVGMYRAVTL